MSVPRTVAIIDFSLGNLYSVKHALSHAGLQATITSSKDEILSADAVILPGVGAYGDAMSTLHRLDLVSVIRDIASSNKPLLGICLGVQLLMSESFEFGRHKGLGIIEGPVVRFPDPVEGSRRCKVPHVGWNQVYAPEAANGHTPSSSWEKTMLAGISGGTHMYFVHSYIVQPRDSRVILSASRYGNVEFCSSLQLGNVFACQFHPEKSGPEGLKVYRNLARSLQSSRGE